MVKLEKQNFDENKQRYFEVKKWLEKGIGNFSIFHVGSTAIPDMYGKNIIDILIGVDNEKEFEFVSNSLVRLGFNTSAKSKEKDYQFFASKKEETSSGDIHIHLAIKGTLRYSDFLVLKKYLLENKDEAKKYSDKKLELINNGIEDRKEYKRIKSEYVSELINRARENVKGDYEL